MQTDRRTAIKNLFLVSAGIVFIPSCLQQKGKPSIVLKNLDISRDDEELLAEISDTLIPSTGTPGAREIGAHLFVLKMVDDCVSKNDQRQFLKGMTAFEKMADESAGGAFTHRTPLQRRELFKTIESKKSVTPELAFFYAMVKKYTVQAYTTSKYFLTNVHVYELIPARFHGCVPIDKKNVLKS